jgi:hypothetical protein
MVYKQWTKGVITFVEKGVVVVVYMVVGFTTTYINGITAYHHY